MKTDIYSNIYYVKINFWQFHTYSRVFNSHTCISAVFTASSSCHSYNSFVTLFLRFCCCFQSRFTCVSFLFHFTFLLISLLVFGDYLGDVGVLQYNHLDHSHVAVSASSWWLSWKRLNIRTDVFELTVISLMWITREKGQLWKVSRSNLCVKTLLSNIRQLPLPPVQMSQSSHCCPFLKHLKHF